MPNEGNSNEELVTCDLEITKIVLSDTHCRAMCMLSPSALSPKVGSLHKTVQRWEKARFSFRLDTWIQSIERGRAGKAWNKSVRHAILKCTT